jgi:drug/metabolite transporter (DMT)-like permease
VKRAVLCCIGANVVAGTTFVVMRRAPGGLPDVTFTFFRLLLATLLFFAVAIRRRDWRPGFSARDWLLALAVALPGLALPLLLGLRGVALSTPGNASILSLLEPIAIVPLSLLFLGERTPGSRLVGLALGLAGAALVITAEVGAGDLATTTHLAGNLMLAAQGAAWAIFTVAAKPLLERHSALKMSAWVTLLGGLACGAVALLEWPQLRPAGLAGVAHGLGLADGPDGATPFAAMFAASVPAMAFLALFGSFLSVLSHSIPGLQGVDATKMAVYIFLQPAVGLVLDAACFGETPAPRAWIGFAAILVAVLLVSREPAPAAAPVS